MELIDLRKFFFNNIIESWDKIIDAQNWLIEMNHHEKNEYFEDRLFKPEFKMTNINITKQGEELLLLFDVLKKKYGEYIDNYSEYFDKMNKYIDNNIEKITDELKKKQIDL